MITETCNELKHGEYKIKLKRLDPDGKIILVDGLVKPLSQEAIADGWCQNLKHRKDMIHHFSISLSQLPINLWVRVRRTFTNDKNKDYYKKIKEYNYHYTIKYSPNDEKILELYKHVMSTTPDLVYINELYKDLDEKRVKGWVMIRALKLIDQ